MADPPAILKVAEGALGTRLEVVDLDIILIYFFYYRILISMKKMENLFSIMEQEKHMPFLILQLK